MGFFDGFDSTPTRGSAGDPSTGDDGGGGGGGDVGGDGVPDGAGDSNPNTGVDDPDFDSGGGGGGGGDGGGGGGGDTPSAPGLDRDPVPVPDPVADFGESVSDAVSGIQDEFTIDDAGEFGDETLADGDDTQPTVDVDSQPGEGGDPGGSPQGSDVGIPGSEPDVPLDGGGITEQDLNDDLASEGVENPEETINRVRIDAATQFDNQLDRANVGVGDVLLTDAAGDGAIQAQLTDTARTRFNQRGYGPSLSLDGAVGFTDTGRPIEGNTTPDRVDPDRPSTGINTDLVNQATDSGGVFAENTTDTSAILPGEVFGRDISENRLDALAAAGDTFNERVTPNGTADVPAGPGNEAVVGVGRTAADATGNIVGGAAALPGAAESTAEFTQNAPLSTESVQTAGSTAVSAAAGTARSAIQQPGVFAIEAGIGGLTGTAAARGTSTAIGAGRRGVGAARQRVADADLRRVATGEDRGMAGPPRGTNAVDDGDGLLLERTEQQTRGPDPNEFDQPDAEEIEQSLQEFEQQEMRDQPTAEEIEAAAQEFEQELRQEQTQLQTAAGATEPPAGQLAIEATAFRSRNPFGQAEAAGAAGGAGGAALADDMMAGDDPAQQSTAAEAGSGGRGAETIEAVGNDVDAVFQTTTTAAATSGNEAEAAEATQTATQQQRAVGVGATAETVEAIGLQPTATDIGQTAAVGQTADVFAGQTTATGQTALQAADGMGDLLADTATTTTTTATTAATTQPTLTRRQRPPKPDFPDPADSQQMSAGFDQSLEGRVGVFNFRTLSESDEFVSEGILDR